ncbi:MAG TPA: ribosome maturation factor RimM [Candidatus Nanopelagicaceae bacterium]
MLLVVGRIGRAHGVLGEATIEVRTDLPDERFVLGAHFETDPTTSGPLTIESVRDHNGILLLKFVEINDRTALEKVRDTLLLADVDMADEALNEDEFHVQQLIGCDVVLESGKSIGELADILNLPGQDVLAVKGQSGEILIPFIEEFVPTIDLERRRITVVPPPGLLELHDTVEGVTFDE